MLLHTYQVFSSLVGRKVSNDGKKFSAYIETDLPICLSNFVYFSILSVKGMWWACIRTNFMLAVAQKTCFYQKITQKIHWNVARPSDNFFFYLFFKLLSTWVYWQKDIIMTHTFDQHDLGHQTAWTEGFPML